jgi:hypothetical protein
VKSEKRLLFSRKGGAKRLLLRPAAPFITRGLLITKYYWIIFYESVRRSDRFLMAEKVVRKRMATPCFLYWGKTLRLTLQRECALQNRDPCRSLFSLSPTTVTRSVYSAGGRRRWNSSRRTSSSSDSIARCKRVFVSPKSASKSSSAAAALPCMCAGSSP